MFQRVSGLLKSHGTIVGGTGFLPGVLALFLAVLCFLGVMAFHFPQYRTTPELRAQYDVVRYCGK